MNQMGPSLFKTAEDVLLDAFLVALEVFEQKISNVSLHTVVRVVT